MAKDERSDDQVRREAERRAEINEIGRFVKAARTERGWSLRRLAEAAGVSASLLSAVENGRIVPTVGSLFSISDALDRPAEDFFPANRRPERSLSVAELPTNQAGEPPLPAPPPVKAIPSNPEAGPTDRPSGPMLDPNAGVPANAPDVSGAGRQLPSPETDTRRNAQPLGSAGRRIRPAPHRRRIRTDRPPRQDRPAETPASLRAPQTGEPVVDERVDESAVPPSPGSIEAVRPAPPEPLAGVRLGPAAVRQRIQPGPSVGWALIARSVDPPMTVIEVTVASVRADTRFRSHDYPTEIIVLSGTLRLEASFAEATLGEGDAAMVRPGVPHRFVAGAADGVRLIVIVQGEWDGTV